MACRSTAHLILMQREASLESRGQGRDTERDGLVGAPLSGKFIRALAGGAREGFNRVGEEFKTMKVIML